MLKWNLKEKFNKENILCIYIIISPVLDIISFLFRNYFKTNFSPVTFLRPVIPIILIIYMFFKKNKKFKKRFVCISMMYFIYAIIHLFIFYKLKNTSSYGGIIHEAQYLVNYSFMALVLYTYLEIFKNKNVNKVKMSVLVSVSIYILSIYISILTKTSSYTYIEQMGYKGWFESGNSLCAILTLAMFIILPLLKEKKYVLWVGALTLFIQFFLMTLVGTRVGFFGFILVLGIYIFTEIISMFVKNKKIDKKVIIIGVGVVIGIIILITIFGSNTIQRRKHLKEIESDIIDSSINSQSHITGSLLEIKEKIDNKSLEDGFMSDSEQKSINDLYNVANDLNITNNDQRTQQLIYNIFLVKNQSNIMLIIFGNGYLNNYRELVCEMEVPAILLNFGIIGFCLYLGPFILIMCYGIYVIFKNKFRINIDIFRYLIGILYAFALALFSGYTFFSQSTVLIIIVLNILVLNKIKNGNKG